MKKNKERQQAPKTVKKRQIRRNNLMMLGISLGVIVVLNIIGSFLFTRLDLTAEKRYSLSPATREFLQKVDDVVYFQVYLDGEFPANYKRLRNATREMLDEFRAYNDNIQYKFIDPSEGQDDKKIKKLYQQLMEKGLMPMTISKKSAQGIAQQVVFPGAMVAYKGRELPLQLVMTQQGEGDEQTLNNAIQNLEYNIANVIRKLSVVSKQRVAILQGHSELNTMDLADAIKSLQEYYDVDTVSIGGKLNRLFIRDSGSMKLMNRYAAIIIAKPDSAFPEKDKYMIDQYIMRGGRVLWFVDPVFASMDSLQANNSTIGFGRGLNIDDMLFGYGVRLNTNLVLDNSCAGIPVATGGIGKASYKLMPWFYFPILTPMADHPIVKGLNGLRTEFISTLDTIGKPGIQKTILLTTSQYSRTMVTPCRITLDIMTQNPDERYFSKSFLPVAVLLRGPFKSNYAGRMTEEIMTDKKSFDFRESAPENTEMIVVADGDLVKNQIDYQSGSVLPLGYDKYTNQVFGNKDFLMNCVDYLCDASGLISVRSRELKIRALDKNLISRNKTAIQLLNTAVPVLIMLLFGLVWIFLRKKYFTK